MVTGATKRIIAVKLHSPFLDTLILNTLQGLSVSNGSCTSENKSPAYHFRKQTFTVIVRPIRPMSIQNRRRAERQCRARTSTTEARRRKAIANIHFSEDTKVFFLFVGFARPVVSPSKPPVF